MRHRAQERDWQRRACFLRVAKVRAVVTFMILRPQSGRTFAATAIVQCYLIGRSDTDEVMVEVTAWQARPLDRCTWWCSSMHRASIFAKTPWSATRQGRRSTCAARSACCSIRTAVSRRSLMHPTDFVPKSYSRQRLRERRLVIHDAAANAVCLPTLKRPVTAISRWTIRPTDFSHWGTIPPNH